MLEERTYQGRILLDCFELLVDALLHALAGFEGVARYASSFCMTPRQFIGIEVRSLARQEVALQFSGK